MPAAIQFEDDDNELVRYARAAARLDTIEAARARRERRKSRAPQRKADKMKVQQLADEARRPTIGSSKPRPSRTRSVSPLTQVQDPHEGPSQKRRKSTVVEKPAPQKRARIAFPGHLPVPARQSHAASSSSGPAPQERRNTAISVFNTRSWSFWLEKEESSPEDPEAAVASPSVAEGPIRRRRFGFWERWRKDLMLHFLLTVIIVVGITLIISGVVYEKTTHGDDLIED